MKKIAAVTATLFATSVFAVETPVEPTKPYSTTVKVESKATATHVKAVEKKVKKSKKARKAVKKAERMSAHSPS